MRERTKTAVLIVLLGVVAFLFGRSSAGGGTHPGDLSAAPLPATAGSPEALVLAQGRRRDDGKSAATEPLVYETSGGSAASANDILAVTGSYGVGTSVLYVLDTKTRQLAVYEARGGSLNSRRLFLVGARRIELDLQLEGYNDESEYSYEDLQKRFRERGIAPAVPKRPAEEGATGPGKGEGR